MDTERRGRGQKGRRHYQDMKRSVQASSRKRSAMANIYAKNNAELKEKVNGEGQAGRYPNGSKEARD